MTIGKAALAILLLGAAPATAGGDDLTRLSLEELMNVEVVTVSKTPQRSLETAAAVTVIPGEDLTRTGVRHLPDALRLAPGAHVAQIDASRWAVSIRGFSGPFTNKLLVLQDGRSLYSPLFGGVFWDVQDTLLEDVERIEVVRGPGGTVWGANAVNGVINILTRSARDTHGTYALAGGGTEERGFASLRHGGQLSPDSHYRVYGKFFSRDSTRGGRDDGWHQGRVGFRMDGEARHETEWTLQGAAYGGEVSPEGGGSSHVDTRMFGGHLLAQAARPLSGGWRLEVGSWYDTTNRDDPTFEEERHTVDVDARLHGPVRDLATLTGGLGYRGTADSLDGSDLVRLDPTSRYDNLVSAFLQAEVPFLDDRVRWTLGTKLEHNDYSGFEVQPGTRIAVLPTPYQLIWASLARAVRTPTRVDSDLRITGFTDPQSGATFRFVGADDIEAEDLTAWEVGYRVQPRANVLIDVALFWNEYEDVITSETQRPRSENGQTFVDISFANAATARARGGELATSWQPVTAWTLSGGYSYLNLEVDAPEGSLGSLAGPGEGVSPRHQVFLRSSSDLPGDLSFDILARFVDELPAAGVDEFFDLDVRLAREIRPGMRLSVVGHDLIEGNHVEFDLGNSVGEAGRAITDRAIIERGVFAALEVRF